MPTMADGSPRRLQGQPKHPESRFPSESQKAGGNRGVTEQGGSGGLSEKAGSRGYCWARPHGAVSRPWE